jgi:diguanylate cyclase (GGDEF)-like protein/PAS domain S-box-containing protein
MQTDPNLLRILFDAAPEGVMVCDAQAADHPVVYVNRAMEQLTGYPLDQLVGKNPRFLHNGDQGQAGIERLRSALAAGSGCHVVLQNTRPDGSHYGNELTLVPLRDAQGVVTHFASFHRESHAPAAMPMQPAPAMAACATKETDPTLSTQTMLAYVRDDKLTGLLRRSYFEDLLQRDWALAQRESRQLTLITFDLDFFGQYRDVFGRQGADQCFRRVAKVIAGCFRRSTDLCGRWDDDQIIALTVGMDEAEAAKFVGGVLTRVRDLAIHHPRSSVCRYVTISAGVGTLVPAAEGGKEQLTDAAQNALQRAKELGRNRVVCAVS